MLWPAFNEFGDLPVGIYRATLAEVIMPFGHSTMKRIAMTSRLEHIYGAGASYRLFTALCHLWELRHRCTQPARYRHFLVMQGGFQPRDAPAEAQPLFRHDTAQSELGASIFWVNAETSFADTEDLIIGWQTRRDLQRRGIVEVVEHDSA